MKKCSTSLTIREMQMSATVRCYYTAIRMVIIKNSKNSKWCGACGEIVPVIHCWWEFEMVQPLRKTQCLKNKQKLSITYHVT